MLHVFQRQFECFAGSDQCQQWNYIADNPLLWQDLDLTSALENTYHLPPGYVPSVKLIARIEKARSIKAIPRVTRMFGASRGWLFGQELAYLLRKLQHRGSLPNLRSLTIQSSFWADELVACLPHLVDLDISRIAIETSVLTSVMANLGSSLRKLILGGLQICRWTMCAIVNLPGVEHLSLAMCQIRPDTLQWFLTGFPIPPVCEHYEEDNEPLSQSERCQSPDSSFSKNAATEMPYLRELDLRYLDVLQTSWLRQFHIARLGLSDEKRPLVSEITASSSSLTHDIHIDVRGCKNLTLADLQGMESTWPGTWFTPSLKAIGRTGAPPRVAASPLPEEAILFAVQEPGATIG